MAAVSVDASELREYASELVRSAEKVAPGVHGVVSRGALNIKRQLQKEMGASTHFRSIAHDISYDLIETAAGVEAEIGPHSGAGSPGALANVAYFGTPRGGGTVPDPRGALESEIPSFEKFLGALIDEAF